MENKRIGRIMDYLILEAADWLLSKADQSFKSNKDTFFNDSPPPSNPLPSQQKSVKVVIEFRDSRYNYWQQY